MKFGVNSFVWSSPCTTAAVKELAPKVKGMGFDIRNLKDEYIQPLIDALGETEIEVDSDDALIKVYAQ